MNQSQRIDELKRLGWHQLMPENELGWRFFFRRDPELGRKFILWNVMHYEYLTVFRNGRTAEGIIETRYQWEKREQQEKASDV